MADVERHDRKVEMKSRCADHQILEGDDVAQGGLLSFDLTGKAGDFRRDGMDEEVAEDLVCKEASALAVCFGTRSIDPMCQFNDADGRDRHLCFAMGLL